MYNTRDLDFWEIGTGEGKKRALKGSRDGQDVETAVLS